jgi:hypothetical protein
MSRQKPKLQIFFMEVNFQFTKAYNVPDTRSIQGLLRRTDTADMGGVKGTIQHFCQKMKFHLPVLSNVKWLMYHRSPNTPSEILRPAKSNNCLDNQENLRSLQNPDVNCHTETRLLYWYWPWSRSIKTTFRLRNTFSFFTSILLLYSVYAHITQMSPSLRVSIIIWCVCVYLLSYMVHGDQKVSVHLMFTVQKHAQIF